MTDGERDIMAEIERDARDIAEGETMTVYLVETGGCMDHDHDILGVFSTHEKAEAFVRSLRSEAARKSASITEFVVDDES